MFKVSSNLLDRWIDSAREFGGGFEADLHGELFDGETVHVFLPRDARLASVFASSQILLVVRVC